MPEGQVGGRIGRSLQVFARCPSRSALRTTVLALTPSSSSGDRPQARFNSASTLLASNASISLSVKPGNGIREA